MSGKEVHFQKTLPLMFSTIAPGTDEHQLHRIEIEWVDHASSDTLRQRFGGGGTAPSSVRRVEIVPQAVLDREASLKTE